jgi:hypothetical protein
VDTSEDEDETLTPRSRRTKKNASKDLVLPKWTKSKDLIR